MRPCRWLAALVATGAVLAAFPAWAQNATAHEVRRGDTLFAIARKAKHDDVTRNQMIIAIWRANLEAFPGGNVNVLEVGTVLRVPPREIVAAINPAEADRLVRELVMKPAAPQVAAAKPTSVSSTQTPGRPTASVSPGREEAAKRYRDGLAFERNGDDAGALKAFLEAGEAGHGLAQRRLGQIYDKGNSAVQRDYQTSLKWYQKAREQGVDIDKPLQRMTTK